MNLRLRLWANIPLKFSSRTKKLMPHPVFTPMMPQRLKLGTSHLEMLECLLILWVSSVFESIVLFQTKTNQKYYPISNKNHGLLASKPIISPSLANSNVFANTLSEGILYSFTIGSINSLKPQEIT